jgi:hypothetical protein
MLLTAVDASREVHTTSATRHNHKGAKGLSRDVARNKFLVNKSAVFVSSSLSVLYRILGKLQAEAIKMEKYAMYV